MEDVTFKRKGDDKMELLDIAIEIERYLAYKGINANEIKASELIDIMTDDGMEEL